MANTITGRIWIVDTQDAGTINTDTVEVKGVRWVGATTAAHLATIKNAAGKIMWTAVANAANFFHESDIQFRADDGIIVDDLDSGILYIYLR